MNSTGRGVLDAPHTRGMTIVVRRIANDGAAALAIRARIKASTFRTATARPSCESVN